MNKLHVSARMKIREGKLEGFKQQAAECIRQTKEKALAEHKHNLRKALGRLFEEFAYDHTVVLLNKKVENERMESRTVFTI